MARRRPVEQCEICGRRMPRSLYLPNDPRPRLKGVCWICMREIEKGPAKGKRKRGG